MSKLPGNSRSLYEIKGSWGADQRFDTQWHAIKSGGKQVNICFLRIISSHLRGMRRLGKHGHPWILTVGVSILITLPSTQITSRARSSSPMT